MKRRKSKTDFTGLIFLLSTMAVGGALYAYGSLSHKVVAYEVISPLASIAPTQKLAPELTTQPLPEVTISPIEAKTDELYSKYKTNREMIHKIVSAWGPTVGHEAVQVAFCESSHNPFAAHTQSSAKGLFQILIGTWNGYKCEGSPLNADDNIACAYKIYQRNAWGSSASWGASKHCHGYK